MVQKPSKENLIITVAIFAWIFVVNIGAAVLTTLPAWPMYFTSIFFFTMGNDPKIIPNIFCGALVGLGAAWGMNALLPVLAPSLGLLGALALMLFVILGLVIVGGAYLPVLFNNVAFAFLTIATINLEIINESIGSWVLMLVVGGAIILGGALGVMALTTKALTRKQLQSQTT